MLYAFTIAVTVHRFTTHTTMITKVPTLHKARFSILLVLALLLPGGLFAGSDQKTGGKDAKAITIADHWSLPGILGAGVKTTDDYTEGNGFLVLPVISTLGRDGMLGGDVIFIEPYSSWGEQGEVAASLGLGWRHLFTDQSVSAITRHDGHQAGFLEEGVFIGANFFVDMLDTQFDNQFWQLGIGIEAGTRYLEVRGNYYIPLSDKQLAFEQRSKQTFTSSSTTTSHQTGATGAPYATGNTIAQDTSLTTFATTTTTTTTIESLFRLYEEGMEGWDAEVALLVPGLDRYMDVKLIGGYFSFDNQPFGPQMGGTDNVEGWKAGIEVRPVPAVVLTATWYEDERFVGSDWLYGLQLQVPFEMGDLGDGKGFWSRIADAFTPRRRHLAERLAEPVHRQNEAIKVGNEAEAKQTASTSVKRVTRVVSQSAQHLVLVDDVVFVNNGDPTGNGIQTGNDLTGTGTAEQPKATIQAGANVAQANSNATTRVWNVYTQGTGVPYVETVGASIGSVNFIGSGKLVAGLNGMTFGTGPMPLVAGSLNAMDIPYLGITAYEVAGGLGAGIGVVDVTNLVLTENIIHNTGNNGIIVTSVFGNTDSALISQNTIYDTPESGVFLFGQAASTFNATVIGNQITNAGEDGIEMVTVGTSTLNATATNNLISGSAGHGISSGNVAGTTVNLTATGNTIDLSSAHGISVTTEGTNTTLLTGNTIDGSAGSGIFGQSTLMSVLTLTITGNSISNTSALSQTGITLSALTGSTFVGTVENNSIQGAFNFSGLSVSSGSTVAMTATISNNTIGNSIGADGILLVTSAPAGLLNAVLDGNAISFVGNGITLVENVGSTLTANGTVNNTVSGEAGDKLRPNGTNPSGTIILNGVSVPVNVTAP